MISFMGQIIVYLWSFMHFVIQNKLPTLGLRASNQLKLAGVFLLVQKHQQLVHQSVHAQLIVCAVYLPVAHHAVLFVQEEV